MKLINILNILRGIAGGEPNVNTVIVDDVYKLNEMQNIEYAAVVINQQNHTINNSSEENLFNINIFYVDRQTSDQSNINDVQSHAIQVLENIIRQAESQNIIPNDNYNITTFEERFDSLCAGAYATVQFQTDINSCNDINFINDVEFKAALAKKQDLLISGENIKTINNISILGSGNIDISAGVSPEQVHEIVAEDTSNLLPRSKDRMVLDYHEDGYIYSNINDTSILEIWDDGLWVWQGLYLNGYSVHTDEYNYSDAEIDSLFLKATDNTHEIIDLQAYKQEGISPYNEGVYLGDDMLEIYRQDGDDNVFINLYGGRAYVLSNNLKMQVDKTKAGFFSESDEEQYIYFDHDYIYLHSDNIEITNKNTTNGLTIQEDGVHLRNDYGNIILGGNEEQISINNGDSETFIRLDAKYTYLSDYVHLDDDGLFLNCTHEDLGVNTIEIMPNNILLASNNTVLKIDGEDDEVTINNKIVLTDAPVDSSTYGRRNGSWTSVYSKTEIDARLGYVESDLDEINGEII